MKKIIAVIISLITITCIFTACGKTWTCDRCGKTWHGDAYYAQELTDTLCAECANRYWNPLPIRNYKK